MHHRMYLPAAHRNAPNAALPGSQVRTSDSLTRSIGCYSYASAIYKEYRYLKVDVGSMQARAAFNIPRIDCNRCPATGRLQPAGRAGWRAHCIEARSSARRFDGNFLLLRPYHGEHGPKVPVTPKYIVLQRVLRKRECMSILTRMIMHLISNDWLIKLSYLNNL
jgi:hypothetical protein